MKTAPYVVEALRLPEVVIGFRRLASARHGPHKAGHCRSIDEPGRSLRHPQLDALQACSREQVGGATSGEIGPGMDGEHLSGVQHNAVDDLAQLSISDRRAMSRS